MRATLMYGAGDVRIENVPDASIEEPTDALIKIHARVEACRDHNKPRKSNTPALLIVFSASRKPCSWSDRHIRTSKRPGYHSGLQEHQFRISCSECGQSRRCRLRKFC